MTEKEKEAEARRLFDEASAALNERNFIQACGQLEGALELLPNHLNIAIKLGDCYERAGAVAAAYDRYIYAKKLAETQKNTKWLNFITAAISRVYPRLSWLTVVVPEIVGTINGIVIMRDGTSIERVDWGMRIPIDRGGHEIWATAPGRKQWRASITIEGESKAYSITVENLAIASPPDPQNKPSQK